MLICDSVHDNLCMLLWRFWYLSHAKFYVMKGARVGCIFLHPCCVSFCWFVVVLRAYVRLKKAVAVVEAVVMLLTQTPGWMILYNAACFSPLPSTHVMVSGSCRDLWVMRWHVIAFYLSSALPLTRSHDTPYMSSVSSCYFPSRQSLRLWFFTTLFLESLAKTHR